jgi:exodeoxyribonuclease VII large subunit
MLESRVKGGFLMKIANMEATLKVIEARMSAADPRKILERGYALAVDSSGVVVKGASGRKVGDKVSVMFADGTLDCVVENIK